MRLLLAIVLGAVCFLVLQNLWREFKKHLRFWTALENKAPELGRAYFSAPYLALSINWQTSALEGVLRYAAPGMERGQPLNVLSQEKILDLYRFFKQQSCHKSCELLRVYLVHRFPHSARDHALACESNLQKPLEISGHLTLKEAHSILGIPKGVSASVVRSAHRQLTKKLHPDRPEGSAYLTTQLNLARDLLLKTYQ